MAWVIENEQLQQPEAKGNWVIEEPQKKAPPKTSYLRAAGAGLSNLATGFLEQGGRFLGSDFQKEQQAKEKHFDEVLRELMRSEGKSEEEIIEEMGEKPPERPADLQSLVEEITGGALTPQTPTERVFAEGGKTGGEFGAFSALPFGPLLEALGFGTKAGAAVEAEKKLLPGLLKEVGLGARFGAAGQVAEEIGFGEVGQFVSGVVAGASPWAWTKSKNALSKAYEHGKDIWKAEGKEVATIVPEFLKDAGTPKALADLQLSERDLTGRVAKISKNMTEDFGKLAGKVGKETMEDVGTFRAADIEANLLEEGRQSILDQVSPISTTKKEGWGKVMGVVEQNFKAAKESYGSMYTAAEEIASKINHKPEHLLEAAKDLKRKMKGSLVSIAEEGGIKGTANNLIKKLIPEQGAEAEKLLADLAEDGIITDFDSVLSMLEEVAESKGLAKEFSLDRVIKTKRSLNRILSKSDIIPAPVDLLKPLVRASKLDIEAGFEASKKGAQLWEGAETLFKKTQEVFNTPNMVAARKKELPEALSKVFEQPSNLEKLNESLGNNIGAKELADRMVVDSITKKSESAAKELAAESREFIGGKGQKALNELLELGSKRTPSGSAEIARGLLLDDIQKAATTGSRPGYALDLMRTNAGSKIAKDALNRSPAGRKIYKSLQRMQVNDFFKSVLKDGKIDFVKAKNILSDPQTRRIIKDAMGKKGLQFFERLETYGKNMHVNLETLRLKDPSFFDSMMDNLFSEAGKIVLGALAVPTKGASLLPFAGKEFLKRSKKANLFKVLENGKAIDAVKNVSKRNLTPGETKKALRRLSQIIEPLIKEDEKS